MIEAVYTVTHSSPELRTVADYIRDISSPAHAYINNMEDFLSVLQEDGVTTNREAIESGYFFEWERKAYKGKPSNELYLPIGTSLAIPISKINPAGLLTQGIEVVKNNTPSFKAKALSDLEKEKKYRPASKDLKTKKEGTVKEEYPDITVWIWCRALSPTLEEGGEIFNLTPFVQKVETNVDKMGGNFNITLPPIVCEISSEGIWKVKKGSIKRYTTSVNTSLQKEGYVAEGSFYKEGENGELKRNEFLFHNIISPNDMVWIRYETLEMEKEQRREDNSSFIIDKKNIAGRIYDMIGLVDTNTQTVNPSNNEVSITVAGRDLSKLFIEDGSYFFPLEMSQGKLFFSGGSTQQNSLMQRVYSDNALHYFNSYYNNSIENVLKFVIQQISTIKVVPDDLLFSYGERRNKRFREKREGEEALSSKKKIIEIEKRAKEKIKQIRIEKSLQENVYTEDIFVQTVWSILIHFFEAIRKQKVRVKANGSTVGWGSLTYISITGEKENLEKDTYPRFLQKHLLFSVRNNVDIRENELLLNVDTYIDMISQPESKKGGWLEEEAKGIWQIVKLVIDKSVTERRIIDSSMSSANGSLLNYIQKVCQEPFVEFYMDTYGDTFNLVVRKPPYDRVGIESMLEGSHTTEESGSVTSTVIDIEAEDVLKESLSYSDKNVKTWYHLMPQGNFLGNTSSYSLAFLPAIFFEEYANIWGSKPMQLVHNYLPYLSTDSSKTILDVCEKQAFEDLKYIVESNAYLPFTREGTIQVNGDRRLKKGNIIRYKSTGEIFFIEHVQQSYSIDDSSIDRSTTIQVSRGMKEESIKGIPTTSGESSGFFSYFDIINTELNLEKNIKNKTADIDRFEIFSNFRVFKECFDFFLKRRMNDDKLKSTLLKEVSNTI